MRAGARVYFINILFKNKLIFTIFDFQLFSNFFSNFFRTFSKFWKIPFIWNAVKNPQLFHKKNRDVASGIFSKFQLFPTVFIFQLWDKISSIYDLILMLILYSMGPNTNLKFLKSVWKVREKFEKRDFSLKVNRNSFAEFSNIGFTLFSFYTSWASISNLKFLKSV